MWPASGGGTRGGEGMECEILKNLASYSGEIQAAVWKGNEAPLILADPMDLTKMVNLPPGTCTLDGIRDTRALVYPAG